MIHRGFCWGDLREIVLLEDSGIDGRKILSIYIYHHEVGLGWDWVDLAEDRDTWRAVVNAVMTDRVP